VEFNFEVSGTFAVPTYSLQGVVYKLGKMKLLKLVFNTVTLTLFGV